MLVSFVHLQVKKLFSVQCVDYTSIELDEMGERVRESERERIITNYNTVKDIRATL